MRLASPVRQRRVASADPHEQAPLSAARPAVPWSMKQCSCDRPRDSPPAPSHLPSTRSLHTRISLTASSTISQAPRVVCSRVSHSRSPQLCASRCVNSRAGSPSPPTHPRHSAHEDEPYHQQLSLSDRNDKIAWTMAECAPAQPNTPHAHARTLVLSPALTDGSTERDKLRALPLRGRMGRPPHGSRWRTAHTLTSQNKHG